MSAQKVPNEVLVEIYRLIPRKTLYQCIQVCKAWSAAAIQEFYKDVSLDGDMITRLQPVLNLPKDQLPIMIGHGEYVKTLKIYSDGKQGEKLNKEQLNSLLSQMPYLKKINLVQCKKIMFYLENLNKIVKNSNKKKGSNSDVLKRIQEVAIKYDNKVTSKPHYFNLCYALRATITHIRLEHLECALTTAGGLTGKFLYFLPHFKNLTHLHINNKRLYNWRTTEYYGGDQHLSMQSILKACPNLIKFKLDSDHPILHVVEKTPFDVILLAGSLYNSSTQYSIWNNQLDRINLLEQNRKSKLLSMYLPDLTFKNFLQYVSPPLSTLELELNYSFDVWVHEHGENPTTGSLLQEFEDRLGTVKILSLYFHSRNSRWEASRPAELEAKLSIIPLQSRISRFELFVDTIYRKCASGLPCIMTLDIGYNSVESKPREFKVTIKNGIMDINYGFRLKSDAGAMVLPSFLGGLGSNMRFLSTLQSIQISLMTTRINRNFVDVSVQAKSSMNEMVESLVLNCPRLAKIIITNCGSSTSRYQFLSDSYNNSRLQQIQVGEERSLTSTKNNLIEGIIQNVKVSAELIDTLNKTFTSIKYIDLQKCTFVYDSHHNVELDLSGITHLKHFEMDVSKLHISYHTHVFFIIDYTNSHDEKTTAYYECKKISLLPSSYGYIHSFNRFSSRKSVAYTLKFSKIDTFSIYNANSNSAAMRADVRLDKEQDQN
jgi:hypothetical protein